ncbi:MAG: hypothetical protein LBU81_00680 [Methanosarcinales archaeon]|jgi:hypothetical protein|nr:hypothetical protein [Methanosarcinales archaeon]
MVFRRNQKLLCILFIIAAAAGGVSGCLSDDGGNTTPAAAPESSDSVPASPNVDFSDIPETLRPIPPFDANLTILDPVPEGFTFFSTATVKSHGQHIGVTDALFGYQGIYHYGENETPVFLTFYGLSLANTTKTSEMYIQMMKDSHAKQYGAAGKISSLQINGRSAVLFEAAADETPQYGKYMIAWTLGSGMFVTVTGTADKAALESLAAAVSY